MDQTYTAQLTIEFTEVPANKVLDITRKLQEFATKGATIRTEGSLRIDCIHYRETRFQECLAAIDEMRTAFQGLQKAVIKETLPEKELKKIDAILEGFSAQIQTIRATL